MKRYNIIILLILAIFSFASCDVEYYDTPNSPDNPPTSALFNDAVYKSVYYTRDAWFSARFSLSIMQYWQQTEYTEEDRYQFRSSQRDYWARFYRYSENLRKVIYFNENQPDESSKYGFNDNQIACARIMLAWNFNIMADTWGDVPYYSYGDKDNKNFQALKLSDGKVEILSPVYAGQAEIYEDILKELAAAAKQLNASESGIEGDNIFHGNVNAWKKFANSLRLRIALKIRGINPTLANKHIAEAQAEGILESNADNVTFKYETSDKNAAPFYRAWHVGNRSDFAVSHSFVELLKGKNLVSPTGSQLTTNPFLGITDPRLAVYAQKNNGFYAGMPIAEKSADAAAVTFESLPGTSIIDVPDYTDYIMEYAEVQFILSELNGWNQQNYEKGVRASMEKWGVSSDKINAYIAALPPANAETVLTQKYIALYMQPQTSWAEYRRTGYPKTLIKEGMNYSCIDPNTGHKYSYIFKSITKIPDLPNRMMYPQQEQTLNGENRKEAVSRSLKDGDTQKSKLWWDVN